MSCPGTCRMSNGSLQDVPSSRRQDIGRGKKGQGPAGSSAQQITRLNNFLPVIFSARYTTPGLKKWGREQMAPSGGFRGQKPTETALSSWSFAPDQRRHLSGSKPLHRTTLFRILKAPSLTRKITSLLCPAPPSRNGLSLRVAASPLTTQVTRSKSCISRAALSK